jgi:diguanylate cyclase (GGDEF)-like protein
MHLDNFTAITIVAAVALVFGFGLLLFHGIQRSFRGLAALGTAYLLLGAGSALIALRGQIPDWASIILSNAMIVSGIATMDEGLSRFVHDRKGHRLTAAALVVLLMAVQFYFSAVAPDLQVRIIFISVIMATMCALVTHSLLAPQAGPRHPSQWFTIAVTATAAAVSLLRAGLTALLPPGETYLATGGVQALSMLSYLLFMIGCVFGVVWMSVQRYEARLVELAERDPLTGLFNRRALEERARREMLLAQRNKRWLSIILFDVDDFKAINDTHGHKAGDTVLQALARAVGQGVRGHDVVARYGGEEFLILLPDTCILRAMELAERLRRALHGLNVAEDGRAIPVTASFGAASLDATTRNWDSLVVNADRALYAAKQAGKDRVARAGQPA